MKILVIPDCQVKPGVGLTYLSHIGEYIVEKKPDVVVCIGDFADMPSLSSYDVGKKSFEGRRYSDDIEVTKYGMGLMLNPLYKLLDNQRKNKKAQYSPRLVMTLGNHENRIERVVESDPKLEGTIGTHQLCYKSFGWEVYPFLEPVEIEGIMFAHYFTSGVMGRPVPNARQLVMKKHQSCVMGHVQNWDLHRETRADGTPIIGLFAGSCLTPDHKVLTANLEYKPLGNIKVGEKLVSFDEEIYEGRSRRYKTGTVEAIKFNNKEVVKVTLQSGKSFKVTKDHRWLVKTGSNYNWRTTDSLKIGTCIPKLFEEWETDTSYSGGWLAGMYDGEGTFYNRKTTGGWCAQLSISQSQTHNPKLCEELIKSHIEKGFTLTKESNTGPRSCNQWRIKGGQQNIVKFLGSIRPKRLLSKWFPESLGRICSSDSNNDKVISIEPIGNMEIVEIAIDAKTMIVEGYPHHNCYTHNEDYLGPQGNNYDRGIWMLHEVNNGSFMPMYVSLNYLQKKYG